MAVALLFLMLSFVAVAVSGCSDSSSTPSRVVASAVLTDDEGSVALASVTQDDLDVGDADVRVNDASLSYGLPIAFNTEGGLSVNITLPIYYAELNQLNPGDGVQIWARTGNGEFIYSRGMVTIPGIPILIEPEEGQSIPSDENVPMTWSSATDAEGYVSAYADANVSDETSTEDEDTGLYAEYIGPSGTEITVPSIYTVVGDAVFSVSAVSGDTDVLTMGEDETRSFFIAATSDWVAATVQPADLAQSETKEISDPELEGSQGLQIVKSYKKKIKGYTFRVRETNPYQMTTPGEVHVKVTMRRFKISLAFILAIDSNGNTYHEWNKKRIYKSHKKSYKQIWSVSPGTTIVIGTHDAKYRSANYYY